jgi:hypothetical protein
MDVFQKRQVMQNLVDGNVTQEDIDLITGESHSESYGDVEHLAKEEADGRRIQASYSGESRHYWVPQDGAWINGSGITLDKAYRIFAEDDERMELREVQDHSERDAIVQRYWAEVKRVVEDK